MKRIAAILFVCLFAGTAVAAENPWDRKLPFKSGTVTYKIAGTMKGGKVLYVKDYGRTSAEYSETVMKMFGMTQNQKEVIITTPEWIYTADLVEMTGTKQANINRYMKDAFEGLSPADKKKLVKNVETMGVSTIEGLEGTIEKKAVSLMGYDCDRVRLMGTVAYNISGTALPLKIEGNTMGVQIYQEAVDLSTGSVASSKFDLPGNISFAHDPAMDQMMKDQARAVVRNLVDGKTSTTGAALPAGGTVHPVEPASAPSDSGLAGDAADVGQAARQEAKDATIEEVEEGVRTLFKSIFD